MSLRSLPEAKALLEAAGTLRRLWVEPPAGHGFETVAGRTGRQSAGMRAAAEADPELAPLVDAALAARAELVEGAPELLLLHGNFRQSKVLSGERAPWLTVGPEPLVGERAYDLARLVRDRAEDLVASPAARRRRGGGSRSWRRRWRWTRRGCTAGRCSGRSSPAPARWPRGGVRWAR